MAHRRQFLRWAGVALSIVLVVSSLLVVWLWWSKGVQLLSVASNSMQPLVQKGDAVVVKKVEPGTIQIGDVVSYPSPENSAIVITHRVVQVSHTSGRLVTKGDRNATTDPPTTIFTVIGTTQTRIPKLGYVLDALNSWPGLILLIYIPALGILLAEGRRIGRYYLRPTYVLRGHIV